MLKSMSKTIALIFMISLLGVSATFAAGAIALQPRAESVKVGEPITYDVLLKADDPFRAYQVKVSFTSADGASVNTPSYSFSDTWVQANQPAYGPVDTSAVLDDGSVVLQSSLVGSDSIADYSTDYLPIGVLTVLSQTKGTLQASIESADFFTNGLEAPEGTEMGVIIDGPISVIIGAVP